MNKRASGVLMHITSLPGDYGIGSFGQAAYDFVDFLVRTKQRYWQILPLGTTSYGDSPYQSFSAFASPDFRWTHRFCGSHRLGFWADGQGYDGARDECDGQRDLAWYNRHLHSHGSIQKDQCL